MKRVCRQDRRAQQGMTLIELMVVIAIIMILMGIVLGISGAAQRGAAEAKAKGEIGKISLEIENYRADRGVYPPSSGNRLTVDFFQWYDQRYADTVFELTDFTGTMPNIRLLDPWGTDYVYFFDANKPFIYRLGSKGPDRQFGARGSNADALSFFGDGDDILK